MVTPRNHGTAGVVPEPAVARSFVAGLAARDFGALGGALAGGACLRALLPSGLREWAGAGAIADLFQLVAAGHDTTASLIGNGVVALLDHPGQLQALLADPGRLRSRSGPASGIYLSDPSKPRRYR